MFFISGLIIGLIVLLIFRGPSMEFHDWNKE